MNQTFIQDFLRIPGVLGVALIQGRALPYIYIKEKSSDWKKKEALAQNLYIKEKLLDWKEKQDLTQSIRQIVAKTTEESEFCEFQVMGYYMYTYMLNSNFRLVILTDTDITAVKLRPLAAKQLKTALQKDLDKVTTVFEFLTRSIPPTNAISIKGNTESPKAEEKSSIAILEARVILKELLSALNHLSQFSSNYMGNQLAANYWQLTRPQSEWLENFQIDRSAKITFPGVVTEPTTSLQHQSVKDWSVAFINQGSLIIRDLPVLIEEKGLDERSKRLLLPPAAD